MIRVLLLSNYNDNFSRYFPEEEKMIWGDVEFSLKNEGEFDGVVILNYSPFNKKVVCNPENVFVLHQEPGDLINNRFMYQYRGYKILSHLREVADSVCQPALGWHVRRNYSELSSLDLETASSAKTRQISGVISSNVSLLGHYKRLRFKEFLESELEIDFYGKGYNFIVDKWMGLYPYKYSVAIENTAKNDYWTEKISDCFLSYTYPIYYGCKNIDKYFPSKSYINVDLNDYKYSLALIKDVMASDYYSQNMSALCEARELVLKKYGFAPSISEHASARFDRTLSKSGVFIKAYRPGPFDRISSRLFRNKYVVKLKDSWS